MATYRNTNMNVSRILRTIFSLKCSPVFAVAYFILLMIPEFWIVHERDLINTIASLMINAVIYAVIAWIMCFWACVSELANNKLGAACHILFHILVYSWTISQMFLIFGFCRHWDSNIFFMIKETNAIEARGFFEAYILSDYSISIFLIALVLVFVELFLFRRVKPKKMFVNQPVLMSIQIVSIIAVVGVLTWTMHSSSDTENYEHAKGLGVNRATIFNLRQSILSLKEYEASNIDCLNTLKLYTETPVCNRDIDDVVLIIGESFSRHHSSIYGYEKETNPLLLRRLRNGEGVAFTDVIAAHNVTSIVFSLFMSLAEDTIKWSKAPLLPAVFKRMGWNTIYYSNQFARNENLDQWNAPMGFINNLKIEHYLFDHRNDRIYLYDLDLVEDFVGHRDELESNEKNFTIYHLLGQHVPFVKRYPASEKFFTADSIKRKDLNNFQKDIVAKYDNATRYNDKVVDAIIELYRDRNAMILYFSDHGEEIYDFRDHQGRTDLCNDVDDAMYPQLDIPFMFFLTEKCKEANPDLLNILSKIKDIPFMTDDLPHFLLTLLQCDSKWVKESLSPTCKDYDIGKCRMPYGTNKSYKRKEE